MHRGEGGEREGGERGSEGRGGCSFLLPAERGPGPNWLSKPRHKEFAPRQASRSPERGRRLPHASPLPSTRAAGHAQPAPPPQPRPRRGAPARPDGARPGRGQPPPRPRSPPRFVFAAVPTRPPQVRPGPGPPAARPGRAFPGQSRLPAAGPGSAAPRPPSPGTACPFKESPHIFCPRRINRFCVLGFFPHTHPHTPVHLFPQRGRSIVSAPPRRNPCPAANGEVRAESANRRETYLQLAKQPCSSEITRKKAGKILSPQLICSSTRCILKAGILGLVFLNTRHSGTLPLWKLKAGESLSSLLDFYIIKYGKTTPDPVHPQACGASFAAACTGEFVRGWMNGTTGRARG
ncbi:basic proline-rich protein-like [Falco biarmicus]|uniref:basic proline-rich protein-like n=1 Tax=Falco cherrug TaxID=345164 RepID=UPI00247B2B64|nr:basic proline-rich protein-like [Falco cherrug]XP_056208747.1 basic proline-rich protein-like [Falco biarmicus]